MVSLTLLLVFHLFWNFHFSTAYPVTPRKDNYTPGTTLDDVATARSRLFDLVNSTANKQVFSQLKYSSSAFYDLDSNTVGSGDFIPWNQYQRQPYVANGYIGARIPNLGQGFTYDQLSQAPDASEDDLSNGWPLFNKRYAGAFIAGFYDIQARVNQTNFPELYADGYESIIAAVPQWTSLIISATFDGQEYTLDPSLTSDQQGKISNYVQNLSLSDGIVTTEFTWLDTVQIKLEVLAHREDVNLGVVHLDIANLGNTSVDLKIEDNLDFESAQRCQLTEVNHDSDGIYITFQPNELDYVNGAIYSTLLSQNSPEFESTNSSVSQWIDVTVQPYSTYSVTKYAGIVSTDLQPDTLVSAQDVLSYARKVSQTYTDIDKVVSSHKVAWAQTLESTPAVTFANDLLLTLTARASIYHITANTRADAEGVTGALSPTGISSDSYGGMVFWDTDLWIFNGILPFIPSHAKSFVNYRIHTHEQAKKNVPEGYSGAVYPWTSGRFGNCTSTGPCLDYEYHINMAVASSAWELYLSGNADDDFLENVAYPLINDAATFYSEYVVHYNESLGKYTTHNLTDPDEYANHVDNGAYTNAGISLVMQWAIDIGNHLGKVIPADFLHISDNVFMPTADNADNITLEYSGMNSSVGIKQADVVMITYPLENELIDKNQAYKNMEFYSKKQVSYGPAMTFPIFSIVASTLSLSGCASQSYLQKAVQPYLRGPFAQFSEQNNDVFTTNGGTHPAFPFMTAHGGFLQAILQGLTGLRFGSTVENNKIVRVLKFDPVAIPCLGDGVSFEGIKYDNHTLSLTTDESTFTIVNHGPISGMQSSSDSIRVEIGERNPKFGTYTINKGDSLTIPLFEPELSFPSSLTECGLADVVNITSSAFGDSPLSINDGDNTTSWQLQANDTTGKILVDLKEYKNITRAFINWGDKPPLNLKVSSYNNEHAFQNTTDFLSKVDFGNDLYQDFTYANPQQQVYKQSDLFDTIYDQDVNITAPFNATDYSLVEIPTFHNSTSFSLEKPLFTRYVLLEVQGVHDTVPIDENTGGAKIYEVVLY